MTETANQAALGAIAIISMGQSPAGTHCNRDRLGAPLLNGPTEFGHTHPVAAQWTTEPTKWAQPGDILFCVRGSTTGRMNIADQAYVIGRGIASIRGETAADTRYLHYAMQYRLSALLAHATGSTFPNVSGATLNGFQVPWFPPEHRVRIAAVLGALDDLIETNKSLVQPLVSLVDAALAKGFASRGLTLPVSEIADVVDCLHSKKPERVESGGTLLQLGNISENGLIDMADRYAIGTEDYATWTRNLETRAWDCVITNVGRVGAVARIPVHVRAALGRNMTAIRPRDPHTDGAFLLGALRSAPVRQEIAARTDSGTVMSALNVRNIPHLRLPDATEKERRHFQDLAGPLLAAADDLLVEARSLAGVRDQLLSLLLSGRVTVGEVAA